MFIFTGMPVNFHAITYFWYRGQARPPVMSCRLSSNLQQEPVLPAQTISSIAFAAIALSAGTATALLNCQTDQHAFDPTKIRFYKSQTDGDWSEVDPLQTPCIAYPSTIIPKEATGL
ncbi:hypothetical protein HD806DRAFT_553316 [Xylariaceae sp. AK1471]|nr:hypothetical protein HD806DRAFT_553316 [Xylariaceae sp. AK1471]